MAGASAATCTLSVQGANFGSYDVFHPDSLDGVANIALSCDAAVPYSIALSPGSGAYSLRKMTSGPHALDYNLFVDAARTMVWGDASAGTAVATGNAASASHVAYGRIPARQNVHAGSYSDTITVTVTY
jgi:spore coat protein U-like protein